MNTQGQGAEMVSEERLADDKLRVQIKPLEWEIGGWDIATTPFGEYSVQYYTESDGDGWEAVFQDADVVGQFATSDEAIAACQSHFNAAIQSCLIPERVEPSPLADWHEDMGDVVWWCWRDGAWLGEAAYIGTPLDLGTVEIELRTNQGEFVHQHDVAGWPGYHTHWTPHPTFPELLSQTQGEGE